MATKKRKLDIIPKRIEWPKLFMDITEKICERSLCIKYKTASIITTGTQIISIGYNGTFKGQKECCDWWREKHGNDETFSDWIQTDEFKKMHREWSVKYEVHAEINALNWISKRLVTDDYALYTYLSPCENCAKSIISYGIKKVYYRVLHGQLDILQSNGVECIQL